MKKVVTFGEIMLRLNPPAGFPEVRSDDVLRRDLPENGRGARLGPRGKEKINGRTNCDR